MKDSPRNDPDEVSTVEPEELTEIEERDDGAVERSGEIALERSGDAPSNEDALGPQGMIPGRSRRRTKFERASMRILATGGIVGLDVALGAILAARHVHGWIDGLAIGLTSVVLAAVLWSSRQL